MTKKGFIPKVVQANRPATEEDAAGFYQDRWKWAEYLATMPDLSDRAFRVGFWLSRRMNADDGCCWYSVDVIAKRMGRSARSVRYAIAELRDKNLLLVVEEPGKANCYFMHAPFIEPRHDLAYPPLQEVAAE